VPVDSDRRVRHVVVVGGGISGLAAAYAVGRGHADVRVTVLDKASDIGGHLRLAEVAGITVDTGAESLLNRRPEAVDLVRAVGLADDLEFPLTSQAGLWTRGAIVRLPASTVMGVPSDASELADVLTPEEVARVAAESMLRGRPTPGDVAVGTLVSERMGQAVTERLVDPFIGGVYAGRADELSLQATMPELAAATAQHGSLLKAAASVRDSVSAGPVVPVFAGIRGGIARLPAAVAAASGAQIRTRTTVRRLSRISDGGGGWRIETGPVSAPSIIDADAVIVAVPATPAARMLRDVAPAAAAELAGVEYASVAIVTLAMPLAAFREPPRWSGYLVPVVDGHVTKAMTISSVKWAWQTKAAANDLVLLRASIGRHRQQGDLRHEDDELVNIVVAELTEALGVTGGPVDSLVSRWGGALPQYAVGHLDRVRRVRAAIDALPSLAVCGAWYDGVGVAACVAGAQHAAARILDGLGLVPVSKP
jgi:protoporphyrinogen/coproporphyrinogen III oxidase